MGYIYLSAMVLASGISNKMLTEAMNPQSYSNGENIIRQADNQDANLYLIESGTVSIMRIKYSSRSKVKFNGVQERIGTRGEYSYFGKNY